MNYIVNMRNFKTSHENKALFEKAGARMREAYNGIQLLADTPDWYLISTKDEPQEVADRLKEAVDIEFNILTVSNPIVLGCSPEESLPIHRALSKGPVKNT